MSDRLAAHRPPTLRNPPARRRRAAIGAAAAIPALLLGALGTTHPGTPKDSGLVACAYPWATQNVPAAEYPKLRAEFAGSRFPDLRTAGTAYVDLAIQLQKARGAPTDTRPSGSTSGCPPPAQSTDADQQRAAATAASETGG